jgi:hypothetical protein
MIARLPDDLRNAIAYGQIVASGWYPVSWHRALHQAAQGEARRGASFAREIGHATARDDFRGIYRWVASLLSPETMVKQAARVFGNYFKNAELVVVEASPGRAQLAFRACHGFDHNLWENVLGGIEAALEVAGATDVVLTVKRGGQDGDSTLDLAARWQ